MKTCGMNTYLNGVVEILVFQFPITYFEHPSFEAALPSHEFEHPDTTKDLRASH